MDKELGCGDDGGDGGDGSDGSDGGDGDLGFELVSEESTGVATSCPHLGGGNVNGGLEGCKKLCIDTNGCNAFNYKNNVCYTKKCADCDIKPYTTHGGWNVWMDKELGCGEPEEPEEPEKPARKTGGDCLTDGLLYQERPYTHHELMAYREGVASALDCQKLCQQQTECTHGTFSTDKNREIQCKGECTHLMWDYEKVCKMFQSHPFEIDMSMMPKGTFISGLAWC